MLKRIIHIGSPSFLSVKNNQLQVQDTETGELNTVPCEDIGVLELDHYRIVISQVCMATLSEFNVAVMVCGRDHHPVALSLPSVGNNIQSRRIKIQAAAGKVLKKQLWQQVIKAKIKNQGLLFKKYGRPYEYLLDSVKMVKSGDTGNQEAIAAGYYWKNIFPWTKFKRGREEDYPNNLLNYAYAVIRAMAARAIVSSGLSPALGLFHKNLFNAFCLADDIMEPYRPYADEIVMEYYDENREEEELGKKAKSKILMLPFRDVIIDKQRHPMMIALRETCHSLVKCYSGEEKLIHFPIFKD